MSACVADSLIIAEGCACWQVQAVLYVQVQPYVVLTLSCAVVLSRCRYLVWCFFRHTLCFVCSRRAVVVQSMSTFQWPVVFRRVSQCCSGVPLFPGLLTLGPSGSGKASVVYSRSQVVWWRCTDKSCLTSARCINIDVLMFNSCISLLWLSSLPPRWCSCLCAFVAAM